MAHLITGISERWHQTPLPLNPNCYDGAVVSLLFAGSHTQRNEQFRGNLGGFPYSFLCSQRKEFLNPNPKPWIRRLEKPLFLLPYSGCFCFWFFPSRSEYYVFTTKNWRRRDSDRGGGLVALRLNLPFIENSLNSFILSVTMNTHGGLPSLRGTQGQWWDGVSVG
mgnify:CR=1 FL=1